MLNCYKHYFSLFPSVLVFFTLRLGRYDKLLCFTSRWFWYFKKQRHVFLDHHIKHSAKRTKPFSIKKLCCQYTVGKMKVAKLKNDCFSHFLTVQTGFCTSRWLEYFFRDQNYPVRALLLDLLCILTQSKVTQVWLYSASHAINLYLVLIFTTTFVPL